APAPQPPSPKSQQLSLLPSTSTRPSPKIQTSPLETTRHTPKHRTHPPPYPILKKHRANPYPLPYPPILQYQATRELIREGQQLVQELQLIQTMIRLLPQKQQFIQDKINQLCQATKDPRSRIQVHLRDKTGPSPSNLFTNAD